MRSGNNRIRMRAGRLLGVLLGLLLAAPLALAPTAVGEHPAGEAAGPVGLAPPAEPTLKPAISGTTTIGSTLTAQDGQWEGGTTLGRYWLRCDALGGNCVFIHRTDRTYTLTASDLGKRIRLRVLATIATGAREVESDPTAVIQAAPQPPPPVRAAGRPTAMVEPSLDGVLREGERIRLLPGLWSGIEPITFGNRWERCDVRRCTPTGTTGPGHTLVAADVGKRMRARVSASNSAGSTSAFTTQSAIVKRRASAAEPMKPFPRIEISGYIVRRGVHLRRIAVRAPPGATVRVACRGRTCPYRASRARMRSDLVVVRRMRGRFLRAGTVIELRVTAAGRIGKYTRFRIRRGRKPARVDLCLVPGERKPARCADATRRR